MTYFISPWLLIMKIPIQICVGKFDSERVLRRQFLHKPDQQIWKKIKNPIIEISSLTSLCINHDQSTHKKSPFALPYAYPIVLQYSVTYAACCYAIVQHIVLFYTQNRVSLGEAFMVMHLGNPLKYPIWLDHPKDGQHWIEAQLCFQSIVDNFLALHLHIHMKYNCYTLIKI